ncbi:calmodulin-regulated spectrin-associated protein 2 isoform X2 [Protopterus annectens]|uniref:calmodulin-regulated spectrin-associated protein 2 isoform X2 n=1 Tax=Protopterus annectens TaxID=7888 RepID=UPI001CF9A5DA|nr:calmodulin-regulated spectrin-associated protein 2 isoform X2 [Protopterus annectens]
MGDAVEVRELKRTYIVPAIKPFDHYDFSRAKIAASIAWLVAKAYGTDNIPEDLKEPFYTDQYEQEHIKPPVVNLLLSAELYCRAGSLILKSDAAKPLLGHDAVIQALAQRGLYVTDQERLVTERDLRKKPIHMSAHLAMIDTLMMAYAVEMVSIEKVTACVQKYSSTISAEEQPYDIEDAVMFWVNKVNAYLKEIIENEQKIKESQGPDTSGGGPKSPTKWFWKLVPARYRKEQTLLKHLPCIPLVENVLKDTTDGCSLAALIHFYCPDIVKTEDICLKETMSLADSLYNLQLIQEFSHIYLNQCCHFTLEDMLYASSSIKNNYLVFLAELFWWFEVVKPSFVQPRSLADCVTSQKNLTSSPLADSARSSFADGSYSPELSKRNENMAFQPLQPLPSPSLGQQQPISSPSGMVKRSTSMSFMDGCVGTWPKEKRSSLHGVSFDITFDKEDTVKKGAPQKRSMTRSVSNEGLSLNFSNTPRHLRKNMSFQPLNGQTEAEGIAEEAFPVHYRGTLPPTPVYSEGRASEQNKHMLLNGPLQNADILDDIDNQIETPSIEEALKIIHNHQKAHRVQSEPLTSGHDVFFLHSQMFESTPKVDQLGVIVCSPDPVTDTKGALSPVTDNTEVDTGIHLPSEDIRESMDEDSSLKDYTVSMDSDVEDSSKFPADFEVRSYNNNKESVSPCPSSLSAKSQAGSTASSSSGVKMTSFAEQKFKKRNHADRSSGSSSQKTTPESSELNIPYVLSIPQTPEVNPVFPGRDTTHLLASEMVQLRMKLEEKRRAIEAHKKRVEAAFTKQRKEMGQTAFLTVVKKKGDGVSPLREEAVGAEDEKAFVDGKLSCNVDGKEDNRRIRKSEEIKGNTDVNHVRWLKSPTTPVETEKQWNLTSPMDEMPGEGDIMEYTKSIEKLNSALHFLQKEMQRLSLQQDMLMQLREHQAWVIPPSQPSPQKQVRDHRTSTGSVGSVSPSPSITGESPRPSHRTVQPSARRSASFSCRSSRTPRPNELKLTPLNRTLTPPQSVDSLPRLRRFSPSQVPIQTRSFVCLGGDGEQTGAGQQTSKLQKKDNCNSPAEVSPDEVSQDEVTVVLPPQKSKEPELKLIESKVSEVLAQPIVETVCLTPKTDLPSQPVEQAGKSANLIEVSLSGLQPLEGQEVLDEKSIAEDIGEQMEDDQKLCCGFFFKDDMKGEDDMALKRAAFLEKRLRREKETQLRKQQMEAELEQKKEESRRKAEEERLKKEDEKARREYIKQEYLRRKQLKLMEDMDTVIRPRSAITKQKKPRPKSLHRDHMDSPKTTLGGVPVSSLSLASLNTGDNESILSGKKTPRSESVEGFLSPCRTGSRNGEKDWENGSTTSSVASGTEYTGPKLYKEPSAKSNKHIIQNAIAHCCLAGKVNEAQKNKVLEEMDKSEANNFLILFRDSGCQFRSLYTYCPETEEISKLSGVGPKSVTRKMIEGLYKYNSDRKQFSHIPAKTMSASVDAVTIHGHLWQLKRPMTPKKVLPIKP